MPEANANIPSLPPAGMVIDPHATHPVTEARAGHPVSPQVVCRGESVVGGSRTAFLHSPS